MTPTEAAIYVRAAEPAAPGAIAAGLIAAAQDTVAAVAQQAVVRAAHERASAVSWLLHPPPASRWQGVRARWFPRCWLRRWPVRVDRARGLELSRLHEEAARTWECVAVAAAAGARPLPPLPAADGA